MTKGFSTYLDAVRFLAALTVVFSHFTFAQFTGGLVPYQGSLAGAAVTIFFVLSGYVIAYVACEKEKTLTDFAISRCARIYSVAIPALILTIVIDLTMYSFGAGASIPIYEYRNLWKYLPVFLTFTSEIFTLDIKVLTDGSFWSLSYEVWYYIAFALAFYLTGWRRVTALALCLIVLGIPVLLYFPVWLFGCAIYYLHRRTSLPKHYARAVALLSLGMFIALRGSGMDDTIDQGVNTFFGGWPFAHLHNSEHFPLHYIVGFITALNFYAVRFCDWRVLTVPRVSRAIAYAASFTFAIYLGHRPLMNFWSFVINHDPNSITSIVALASLVAGSVFLFGLVSEHRKKEWRALFVWLFQRYSAYAPRLRRDRLDLRQGLSKADHSHTR